MRKDEHVSTDALALAVTDERLLTKTQRDHIAACPACRAQKERLEQDLLRFGERARAGVPPLRAPIRLPARESVKPARTWRRQLAFGSALATVVVAVLVSWSVFHTSPPVNQQTLAPQDTAADELLLDDTARIAENPLPEAWSELAYDADGPTDEEVIDYVVPGGDESVS